MDAWFTSRVSLQNIILQSGFGNQARVLWHVVVDLNVVYPALQAIVISSPDLYMSFWSPATLPFVTFGALQTSEKKNQTNTIYNKHYYM